MIQGEKVANLCLVWKQLEKRNVYLYLLFLKMKARSEICTSSIGQKRGFTDFSKTIPFNTHDTS